MNKRTVILFFVCVFFMTLFLYVITPESKICIKYKNVSTFDDNESVIKCFNNNNDLNLFIYNKKKSETNSEIYSTDFLLN